MTHTGGDPPPKRRMTFELPADLAADFERWCRGQGLQLTPGLIVILRQHFPPEGRQLQLGENGGGRRR